VRRCIRRHNPIVGEFVGAAWSAAEAVGAHLAGVSPALLAAGLALHVLKVAARARAWQNALRASLPGVTVRFGDTALPCYAGVGAGAVVPFGGGTVMRIALARSRLRSCAGAKAGAPAATIVGSLAPERAVDVLVTAAVVGVAVSTQLLPTGVLHGTPDRFGVVAAHPAAAGLAAAAVILAVAVSWSRLRVRLAAVARDFRRGLLVFRRPSYLSSVAAWQLLAWLFRFASLVLLLEAFHVRGAAAVAPLVLSLQLVAASVPLTPGGAGTQQALVAAAVGSGTLVAFSAAAQVATMLVDVLLGSAALAIYAVGVRSNRRLAGLLRPLEAES
jgi:uncharacterized membrane protein YbhN (UPF0104 family)